jgi:diguanylate cyclase (GGDEF)-like protein
MLSRSPTVARASPALHARFVRVLRAMLWFGVAAYGSYLVLFAWLGVPGMPAVNAGMVSVCLLSQWLLSRGRVNFALAAGTAMVVVHALCATWLLGWAGEFHLYVFLIMSLLLLSPTLPAPAKLAVFVGLTAAYAYAWWRLSGVDTQNLTGLFGLFNVVVFATLLAVLSAIFSSAITQTAGEFEARNAELSRQAATDPLTGLYNRRYLLGVLEQETARYLRSARGFAVIVGDIDNFKSINDRHGHQCGDAVIVAVAAALRDSVRVPDLVARWGGEEFLVFLPETSLDEALGVAARIQAQLARAPVSYGSLRLDVRMTLGVAPMGPDGSVERLLQRADEALYRGKRAGRNRIEVVSEAVAAA